MAPGGRLQGGLVNDPVVAELAGAATSVKSPQVLVDGSIGAVAPGSGRTTLDNGALAGDT